METKSITRTIIYNGMESSVEGIDFNLDFYLIEMLYRPIKVRFVSMEIAVQEAMKNVS